MTPGHTVGRIFIGLEPDEAAGTVAEITYMYTALSEAGKAFVYTFTEEAYVDFMQAWEQQLNHYLQTGEKLDSDTEA